MGHLVYPIVVFVSLQFPFDSVQRCVVRKTRQVLLLILLGEAKHVQMAV